MTRLIGSKCAAMLAAFAAVLNVSVAEARLLFIGDPAADAIYTVDASQTSFKPTLLSASGANSRGTGPPFGGILDVAVSPEGGLFVLDGPPSAPRILQVDRTTGDRTLVMSLSGAGILPHLLIREGGQFVTFRGARRTGTIYDSFAVWVEDLAPQPGGSAEVLVQRVGVSQSVPLHTAFVGGKVHMLMPPVSGGWLLCEVDSIGLGPTIGGYGYIGGYRRNQAGASFTTFSNGAIIGADFILPSVGMPHQGRVIANVSEESTNLFRISDLRATPPDLLTRSGRVGTRSRIYSTANGTVTTAPLDGEFPASGAAPWTVRVERPTTSPPPTLIVASVSLYWTPFPRATLIAGSTDPEFVTVFESFPPATARYEFEDAQILDRVLIAPPPEIASDVLGRACDFVLDGDVPILAMPEDVRIVRVDPTTGTSVLLTTGRPTALIPPPEGFHPRSLLSIALEPPPTTTSVDDWSMY